MTTWRMYGISMSTVVVVVVVVAAVVVVVVVAAVVVDMVVAQSAVRGLDLDLGLATVMVQGMDVMDLAVRELVVETAEVMDGEGPVVGLALALPRDGVPVQARVQIQVATAVAVASTVGTMMIAMNNFSIECWLVLVDWEEVIQLDQVAVVVKVDTGGDMAAEVGGGTSTTLKVRGWRSDRPRW